MSEKEDPHVENTPDGMFFTRQELDLLAQLLGRKQHVSYGIVPPDTFGEREREEFASKMQKLLGNGGFGWLPGGLR